MGKLGDWLNARTGHRVLISRFLDHPIAGGASWAKTLGSLVGACFVLLAATGIFLMTSYAPAPQTAWASVRYIDALSGGAWVRGLHYFASDALIVLVFVHLARTVIVAGYRKPRELWFWMSLALVGVVMGAAITGHLLPWDQKGWWARKVEAGIVGMGPGGALLQQVLQGGSDLGALSLTRAYATHVALLPASFILLLGLLAHLARRADAATEIASPSPLPPSPAFRQLSRNLVAALLLFAALVAIVWTKHSAPLDAPADPLSDYPARPEWFLLPLFELRKHFHGALEFYGTAGLPALLAGYVFALPFLDKRGSKSRALVLAPLILAIAGAGMMSVMALRRDAGDAPYQKQRAAADKLAQTAARIALAGVPPSGALDMMRNDPDLRGAALFQANCASCHLLGDLGDPKKSTATKLDGWGTQAWLKQMIHDPDAVVNFGKTPYKGEMPSVDAPTGDAAKEGPMLAPPDVDKQLAALALFLSTEGDEPGERTTPVDAASRALGEKIVSETCTNCHLYKGEGDDNGQGEAPELSRYGSFAWTRAQIANAGTSATYREHAGDAQVKGLMPRFDGQLSPSDIDLLARWTRSQTRAAAQAE